MPLKISQDVREKLDQRHKVTEDEINECFANRTGKYLDELRQQHQTNPNTLWFVSETDHARKLKVVFIQHPDGVIEIKSTFPPNQTELNIYTRHGY